MASESKSSFLQDEEDDEGNSEERDDFGCVPVNNMDHDTVHIKVVDDEPRFY